MLMLLLYIAGAFGCFLAGAMWQRETEVGTAHIGQALSEISF